MLLGAGPQVGPRTGDIGTEEKQQDQSGAQIIVQLANPGPISVGRLKEYGRLRTRCEKVAVK